MFLVRGIVVVLLALAAVVGVYVSLVFLDKPASGRRLVRVGHSAPASPDPAITRRTPSPPQNLGLFGEGFLNDSGYPLGYLNTLPIHDRASLEESAFACRGRADRGIAKLQEELAMFPPAPVSPDQAVQMSRQLSMIAMLLMYDGRFAQADPWIARSVDAATYPGVPLDLRANLVALRGVNALRLGEVSNCLDCRGPSSCLFPIAPEAMHRNQAGSRDAIKYLGEYLVRRPEDIGMRWLLNIAFMTVGEYPAGVPPRFLIPLNALRPGGEIGRFKNVAADAGLNVRPPNMSGGVVFDDFDGDGRPDVFTTTTEWDADAALYLNKGDGTFEDRGEASGLKGQMMSLNCAQADFDNDGDLDLVLTRGGWEDPYRLTLLRNSGLGSFEDVTLSAGLGDPISSQTAAWGDYDNDGHVDLFIGGEYIESPSPLSATNAGALLLSKDPRNTCRLYRNRGDGTFEDVASAAGVANNRWTKGATWGDYDDDGHLDLYLSNMDGPNRLYRNAGDGTFVDVGPELKVTDPNAGFACWFWDYDNDGRLDILALAFHAQLNDVINDALGRPSRGEHARLYRNLGPSGFRDVTAEVGLDRVLMPMGASFADVDNDGFLDVYLGTGRPAYSSLVPNVMFKNLGGKSFVDVTTSSGTGHLQKGHGIGFADYDGDGDVDLFVQAGGATPGDRANNQLFQNPGHGRHWLAVRLVGTRSNRSAFGAKIRADLVSPDGSTRSIHRRIGGGSSFGGNTLVASLGLGDSESLVALTITWPAGGAVQTFRDLHADQLIEISEGSETVKTR